jgi:bifunctional non-homologous end joining protein LigD
LAKRAKQKEKLEEILKKGRFGPRVNYSEHARGSGEEVIRKACGMDLEGIVSKKIDAPYVPRRDPTWVKSKCTNRQEFSIIGYTDPKRSRSGFGSILVGYHDDERRLVYAGRVGTGFDERGLNELIARLRKIEIEKPPTDVPPPARERRHAHWAEPKLVADVRFTSWTRDGVLRQFKPGVA